MRSDGWSALPNRRCDLNVKFAISFLSAAASLAAVAAEYTTVLMPCRDAVVASKVDSTLKTYSAKVGDRVKAGQVLVEAEDDRYRLDWQKAKEQFSFTDAAFKDKEELLKKDFCSDFELKRAKFDRAVAETSFREAELNLGWCAFKAPFDGKFAEILTKEYDPVKPGQPVLRVIDDTRLFAVANVPLGFTASGRTVRISVGGQTVSGTVYEVAPQADNRTGTVRIRVLVENADGKLAAGMTGLIGG